MVRSAGPCHVAGRLRRASCPSLRSEKPFASPSGLRSVFYAGSMTRAIRARQTLDKRSLSETCSSACTDRRSRSGASELTRRRSAREVLRPIWPQLAGFTHRSAELGLGLTSGPLTRGCGSPYVFAPADFPNSSPASAFQGSYAFLVDSPSRRLRSAEAPTWLSSPSLESRC